MIGAQNGVTGQTTLFASQGEEGEQQREDIDFKMVTFSLGGKDYGVDIMKVKEIAKFEDFTYVPNTQPFVSGVYNLRGDIISVIDLRVMFNLPVPQRTDDDPEDGLIVRLDTGLIGVVVDTIDRVVGISSESIQPPHPIFADVNIKYISGVVEHDGRLYIILDVERILGDGSEEEQAQIESTAATNAGDALKFAEETSPRTRREEPEPGPAEAEEPLRGASSSVAEMVAQTLQTLTGFTMTSINRTWVEERLNQWQSEHAGDAEITTQEHVEEFLSTFYSPYRGRFWDEDYANQLKKVLPADLKGNITVWNPGCGRGHEAYSIACLVRSAYPEARIKVWAEDNDLLNVSSAPSLAFTREEVPGWYEPYLVEGSNGPRFSSEIRDSILFEYSEVTNASSVPPCDLIVIRDVLSFLSERDQRRVLEMIEDRAKDKTIVVPGANEDLLPVGGFTEVTQGAVRAFRIG